MKLSSSAKKEPEFEPIKRLIKDDRISHREIEEFSKIDYPLFSFKYFRQNSIKDCADAKFFMDFLNRLQKLSDIGWPQIRMSPRHQYGMESIPREAFKPSLEPLKEILTPDVRKLHVLRANTDNRPFVGLQVGKIFHIFFIEAKFGDIYDHD
jgi:hypothetical protein